MPSQLPAYLVKLTMRVHVPTVLLVLIHRLTTPQHVLYALKIHSRLRLALHRAVSVYLVRIIWDPYLGHPLALTFVPKVINPTVVHVLPVGPVHTRRPSAIRRAYLAIVIHTRLRLPLHRVYRVRTIPGRLLDL